MRRFLLTILTLAMTISMMAVGMNDGSSKANAIDFSWSSGHDHDAGEELWYRVDLDSISGLADPTLALYMTNMSNQASKVTVDVSATIEVSTPFFSYSVDTAVVKDESHTIAARDYKLMSQNVKMLIEMNVRYLYLNLHSEQNIKLSAKKYETSDIVDDACTKAEDFDWNGKYVPAGETWYRLNLAKIKDENKKLNFVVANNGTEQAEVKFELSLDCPASTIWGYNWIIPAGGDMTEEFGRIFIDELDDDYVYLKLTTDQQLNLKVEEEVVIVVPPAEQEKWTIGAKLQPGQPYTITDTLVFEVDMATLSAPRGQRAEFVVTNEGTELATLKKSISFTNPIKYETIDKVLEVEAGATVIKEVAKTGAFNSNTAYVRFTTDKEVTVQLNYIVVNQEVVDAKPVVLPTCENSELLNWNSVVKQKGLENKWYEIDLSSIKQNDEHLQLTFTNKSNNLVVVMGEIMSTCNAKDTIPYILPLQPGQTLSQVINYNLFALLPHPEHFYVSAMAIPTTATSLMELKDIRSKEDIMKMVPRDLDVIQAAEVELVANTFSAKADPTDCNQAVTIAKGVKYEQAAGTTKWYRVTDELLSNLSLIPDIAFINNGKSAANITMAAGVDCEHSTFALTTIAVPTWADMTLFPSRLVGNLLDKVFNEDVEEMYLQVTTDQPIAFGIDIDYGFGLGCDDARKFNWETGTTIMPGDAQWLDFDITSVKANKQQVTLTLTNESNSLAWVGMMVSLTCPFDVALPLVFPIPAGASVEKVVDYSYFASTKLDQLYIGLITEEKISVKATAVKATASASDKNACENAVVVENGGAYTHNPGTTWYKFDRSLFNDVSRLPKFRYAAEGTATITLGATVGCEYNIATHGTIKLPSTKGIEVSFRTPGFIYDLFKKFVHEDVDAYYLELTSDQTIKFGLDMEYAGGCEQATRLDLNQPLDIQLVANEDVWYSVDLKDVKAMGDKTISFNLNNPSDEAVEVEFELTPTCPLVVSAIKAVNVPAGVNLPLMFKASTITNLYDQVIAQFNVPEKIANNLPSQLQDDLIYYVRVRAKGDLSIGEGDSIPEYVEPGCDEATPLDITQAIDVEKLEKGWYVADLTKINSNFTLKLINNTGSNQTLDFQFYTDCSEDEEEMKENYYLTSYHFVVPTTGLEQEVPYSLLSSYLSVDVLYIYIDKAEGGEVDMACLSAIELDPYEGIDITLIPDSAQWFKVATNVLDGLTDDLMVTAINPSASDVNVSLSLATDCPALATVDTAYTVEGSFNRTQRITASVVANTLNKYADKFAGIDTAYIRVLANEALTLKVDTVAPVKPADPDSCSNGQLLDWKQTIKYSQLTTGWYKFDISELHANPRAFTLSFENDYNEAKALYMQLYTDCESSMIIDHTEAFEANKTKTRTIAYSLLTQYVGKADTLYAYVETDVPLPVIPDADACLTATKINWNDTVNVPANDTVWYELDLATVKAANKPVKISIKNTAAVEATVYAAAAETCPVLSFLRETTQKFDAYATVGKTLTVAELQSMPDYVYLKLHSSEALQIIAEYKEDKPTPTGCEAAKELDWTQVIDYSTLVSGWYKFGLTDLHANPRDFELSIVNNTGENKAMYMELHLDCQSGSKGDLTQVLVPGLTTRKVAYSTLVSYVGQADTIYAYVETDVQLPVIPEADACTKAIELTWNSTLNIVAGDTTWYMLPLAEAKATGKDLEMTISNNSGSVANVYVALAETCPVVAYVTERRGSVEAGSMTKLLKNNELKSLADTVYFLLSSSQDLSISVSEYNPLPPVEPDSCLNGTLLDWTQTIALSTLTTGWYKFDLSSLHASQSDFSLSLDNDMGETKAVDMTLYLSCDQPYEAKTTQVFPVGLTTRDVAYSLVTKVVGNAPMVYVYIKTDVQVPVIPDADACLKATKINWNDTVNVPANDTVWYELDLATVKAANKPVKISIKNTAAVEAIVYAAAAETCPVLSFLKETTQKFDAYATVGKTLTVAELQSMPDYVYLKLHSSEALQIIAEYKEDKPTPTGCEAAVELDWTQVIDYSTLVSGWYKFGLTDLHANPRDFELSIVNNTGENKAMYMELHLDCQSGSKGDLTQVLVPGLTTRKVAYSTLVSYVGQADTIYAYVETDVQLPVIPDADACLKATKINWNDTVNVPANDTVWYELDLAEVKAANKPVKLTIKNTSDQAADVFVAAAETCPVLSFLKQTTVTLDANFEFGYVIQTADLTSLPDHIYLKLHSTQALQIAAEYQEDIVTPDVPEGCDAATDLDWTKTVNLSELATGWYRVDLMPLKNGLMNKISINNDLGKETGVKMDIFRNCDESSFVYTYTHAFEIGLFEQTIPSSLVSMLGSATELYIYLTMDVDILTCEDAIEFDWSKGAVHQADDTQWYHFDITSVKTNAQQVKLTFTNHSSELAIVYGEVALHCPYTKSIPYACVVPAGMSIDKVVDYSVFASSRVEEMYVKVHSTETIELGASTESALVFDNTPCDNATVVTSGVEYTQQAGTSWYKFSKELFMNTGKLPKFYFTTESEGLTTITLGATVGCEYNIATKTIVKVPGSLNYAVVMPEQMFDLMDKMVNDEVTEVYVEMTTDKAVTFSVDMINDTNDPCHSAELLDITKGINLEANQEKWYKIDLDALKAMKSDVAVKVINPSAQAVTVDMEFSPTCPVIVSLNKSLSLPGVPEVTKVISQSLLSKIPGVSFYVRFVATQDVQISFSEPELPEDQDACENATLLDWTKTINLSDLETGWYKFDLTQLHAEKKDFSLSLNNDLGRATVLGLDLYENCESARLVSLTDSVSEGLHVKSIAYGMVTMMIGEANELYAYITIDATPVPPTPAEGCETAIDYVLGTTITVEANSDVWYAIDLAALKQSEKSLDIKIKNVDVVEAQITAAIAFACPGTIEQQLVYSIQAGDSLAATVPYSYYKDLESDILYLNLKTTAKLEITVGESEVVTPDVPEGCDAAIDLDWTKTINLSELATGWYRVDLMPLKNGLINKISINNDLGKETGVRMDIFRNCDESSFVYTYTHAFEVGLFEQTIPSSLVSMLGSATELYIYLTMDVDILTCEDAIEFDWSKGAVHQADDTQWYHFDITSVKTNAQQVKLTFTNHSSDLAIVYGEVALHCPYTKSIPYACVVPAGMSIDKVVDYSVFASSRVEEMYVKVHSTETIELGASTESALVFDNTPCDNATVVTSGVEYTQQAGTSWYKFSKELFMNTGKLPKFYFTTESEGLTTITLGATVGCEYNIATKTIVKVPGSLNYAVVMPEQMFDLMDKMVNDEVTEVYVEMTTDKAVTFSVDMINDTNDPCHSAELLDITKGINLEANQEKWYKIDLDALKAMKSDVAVKVINPSAQAVTVDMEFSPTCPVIVSLNKSLSLPGVPEVTKVISQSLLSKIPGVSFYVRFVATQDVQISFSEPELPEDQDACENATLLDWTKTINLSDLETGWYKFDLTQLHAEKKDFTLSFNNDRDSIVNLGMDLYENCTSAKLAGTVYSFNPGITSKSIGYSSVTSMIGTATELYVYLTIDAKQEVVEKEECENATDYVWGVPTTVTAGSDVWYAIDITAAKASGKALQISVANVDTQSALVSADVLYSCPGTVQHSLTRTIGAGEKMSTTLTAEQLNSVSTNVLYLHLTTTAAIEITVGEPTVVEKEECENATDYVWGVPTTVTAGSDVWYAIDITAAKASGKALQISVANVDTQSALVSADVLYSCPGTVQHSLTRTIGAGEKMSTTLTAEQLNSVSTNVLYLHLTTTAAIEITVGEPTVVEKEECENAIDYVWGVPTTVTAGSDVWYAIDITAAKASGKALQISVANVDTQSALVSADVLYSCPGTVQHSLTRTIGAGEKMSTTLTAEQLNSVSTNVLYLHLTTTAAIEITVGEPTVVEKEECENAIDYVWGVPTTVTAGSDVWYAIDIAAAKASGKDLSVSVKNIDNVDALVNAQVLFDCPGTVAYELTRTIAAGDSLAANLPASNLQSLTSDVIYLHLVTTGDIEITVGESEVVTPDVPEGCDAATDLDWTKTINLSELATGWYRVDLMPLKNGLINKISINNDLGKETGVRMDIFRNCDESSFVYTYTHAFEVGLFEQTIPSSLVSMLGSATELYIYLTMDVDILTCEDAIEFDWSKGAVHQADDTQWYHFDITSVKTNAQQVKLTFTNHSSDLAIVYGEVALHCPYTKSIPYACVVPAGMSIDKVVDYSVFASSRVEEMYVKVHSTETIELGASTESALVFDNTPCDNATVVTSGVEYTQQAGTSWYKFSKELFMNTGKLPKFYFTTESEGLTTITLGATVGCEYNIATKTIVKVPGSLNYAVVMPEQMFDLMDKMVNDEVTEVYVEMTTDKAVTFSVDMINDTDDPCHSAELVELNQEIHLEANQDAWYKVDLGALKAANSDLAITILNPTSSDVVVDMELSPTCPVVVSLNKSLTVPGLPEMTKVITAEQLAKIPGLSFYVRLQANAELIINVAEPELPEDQDACENATLLDWTKTINLSDLETGWYKFDLTELHAQKKDFTLSFNNDSDSIVNLGMDLYENCTSAKLAGTVYSFNPGITSKSIGYSSVTSMIGTATELYVYLTINELDIDVEACKDAIDYILGTTIQLQGETDAWYKINIADAKKNADDLILTVANETSDTAMVTLELAYECPVTSIAMRIEDMAIEPNSTLSKTLPASYYVDLDVDSIYLHAISTGALTITVTPDTTKQVISDTVVEYYCPSDLPTNLVWNDTVKVSNKLDSVITHIAKSLITPVALTKSELITILGGAQPEIVAGTTPDWSATAAAIMAYYTNNDADSIADVADVTWMASSLVPCDAAKHTMTLVVKDECDNEIATAYEFDVKVMTVQIVEQTATICPSELPYTWNAMTFDTAGTHVTTLTNMYGCDSAILTLHLNVLPAIPVTEIEATICFGEVYPFNGQNYSVTGQYTDTLRSVNGCDSVVVLNLTVLQEKVVQYDTVSICLGDSYVWPVNGLTYSGRRAGTTDYSDVISNVLGCDSIEGYLHLTVLPAVKKEAPVTAHICYGEKYDWRGKQYTVAGTYGDTLRNVAGCDSVIYTLNLTASAAPIDSMTRVMLCAGDSYKWDVNGQSYMYPDQGTYNDTYVIKDQYDCDSIICELELVVSDGLYPYSETVCYGESYDLIVDGITHTFNTSGTHVVSSQTGCQVTLILTVLDEILPTDIHQTICYGESYDWEHETFTQSGDYTKTLISSLGCDSVVTLHLTVLPEVVGQTEHKTVCFGETYEWHQVTYDKSGTYTANLQDSNGCTYTDTLILTILAEVPETMVDKYLCEGDSMLWDGQYIKQSGLYPVTLQDSHDCDSLVTLNLTFVQGSDSTIYKTICSGETYVFQNQTLTQSGTYVDTIAECNTTITLHLTVNQAVTVEVTEVVNGCAYDWNGVTYTTSGDYTYKTTGINGCDSTTILHLTLVPTVVNAPVDTVTLCYGGTHLWRDGKTYSTAGTYTYVEKNANDCDSTRYTLELIVRDQVMPTIIEQTICYEDKPYIWDVTGLAYDTTDYYEHTLTDVNGCDSTVILRLVVFDEIPVTVVRDTINEGDSYTWNGKTYTTAGDYIDTIPSTITSCDSIVTLSLHVIPQKRIEVANITAYVCDGTEYIDPVTNKKHIITSLIPSTQTWSDTIVKSPALDSIYNYVITPIVAPEVMTDSLIATIAGASPVLTRGAVPNVTGTIAALQAYYDSKDTEAVADINSITWTNAGVVVACDATEHKMTLVVEAGCDTKITTELTFDVAGVTVATHDTATICFGDTYTWIANDNKDYNKSGIYVDTLLNQYGCDSLIITLNLTVLPEVEHKPIETKYICHGEKHTWRNKDYDQTGVYYDTVSNFLGCDTLIFTLDLTVLPEVEHKPVETKNICFGEKHTWRNKDYDQTGVYYDTVSNFLGCDTLIFTLDLTVLPEVEHKPVETKNICFGEKHTWRNKDYDQTGVYYDTVSNFLGCDTLIFTLDLTVLPEVEHKPVETKYICFGEKHTWRNKDYDQTGVYYDTVSNFLGCDTLIFTLDLTVLPEVEHKPVETKNICFGEKHTWRNKDYDQTGVYYDTVSNFLGCDSLIFTLDLTVLPEVEHKPVETKNICFGEKHTWRNKDYAQTGVYYDTVYNFLGCDSLIFTLNLTVLPEVEHKPVETKYICFGEKHTWRNKDYAQTGVYYDTVYNFLGCDSLIFTLDLHILPDVEYAAEETAYFCPNDTYTWDINATMINTYSQPGIYKDTLYNFLGCDSVIYTLNLYHYDTSLPIILTSDITAICGNAIDVSLADAIVKSHIAATEHYVPTASVKWYVLEGTTYKELTTAALDGTIETVTMRYAVVSECDTLWSDPITDIPVQDPTPENDPDEMAGIDAVSKYGNRILLVNVKIVEETFGWVVEPEDVAWYKIVDDMDDWADPASPVNNDEFLANGYFYNLPDGESMLGEYYARIQHEKANPADCNGILQTETLICGTSKQAPMLLPNIVKPSEVIRLVNLDPTTVSTITMYSTAGETLATFQSTDSESMTFNAAQMPGFYIVEVMSEEGQVSLRYIVK